METASAETGGIATADFAQSSISTTSASSAQAQSSSQQQGQGGLSSQGFFVSNVQNSSSSSHEQTTTQSDLQHVTSGKLTFKVPDFGQGSTVEETGSREKMLSPTQSRSEEGGGKGDGLF